MPTVRIGFESSVSYSCSRKVGKDFSLSEIRTTHRSLDLSRQPQKFCSCLFEIWRWRGMSDSILSKSSHELGSGSLCKIRRVRACFSHGLTVIDVPVADRTFVRLQPSRLRWMFVVQSTSETATELKIDSSTSNSVR